MGLPRPLVLQRHLGSAMGTGTLAVTYNLAYLDALEGHIDEALIA